MEYIKKLLIIEEFAYNTTRFSSNDQLDLKAMIFPFRVMSNYKTHRNYVFTNPFTKSSDWTTAYFKWKYFDTSTLKYLL